MLNRYLRNKETISATQQEILAQKSIIIIGCGGLGQYVASELCRVGIGSITLMDDGDFDETNLNRQLYCTTKNMNKPKVGETAKQLIDINPEIKITPIYDKLTEENAKEFIKNHDLVIDALDNIKDRLVLEKACKESNIVLISAAIGGWYGQLAVIRPGDDTLSKIYKDINEMSIDKVLGNPAFTPALLASMQTCEAVKYLLGKPTLPSKCVLYIDLLNLEFSRFSVN